MVKTELLCLSKSTDYIFNAVSSGTLGEKNAYNDSLLKLSSCPVA